MPRFKETGDRGMWTRGMGPQQTRTWISQVNAISKSVTGKSCVVTSWYRDDQSFHADGRAVDFRRCSEANEVYPQYTEQQAQEIERRAEAAGVPMIVVARGGPAEHWHCGDVWTGVS